MFPPLNDSDYMEANFNQVICLIKNGREGEMTVNGILFNEPMVLGVIERVFESPRGSEQRSAFDLDDTIVPARLEDLAVETRWTEEATDDLLVEFESIRDDQREDVRNSSA